MLCGTYIGIADVMQKVWQVEWSCDYKNFLKMVFPNALFDRWIINLYVIYTEGISETGRNICTKHGIKVHFKGCIHPCGPQR